MMHGNWTQAISIAVALNDALWLWRNLVRWALPFPSMPHDDMLDALSYLLAARTYAHVKSVDQHFCSSFSTSKQKRILALKPLFERGMIKL